MIKKFLWGLAVLGLSTLGFCGGYIAYAEVIPGVDEPYDPEAYYSPIEISYADSAPSIYAQKDMRYQAKVNGGKVPVYDFLRHVQSALAKVRFIAILQQEIEETRLEKLNTTPFEEDIRTKVMTTFENKTVNTKKVAKKVNLDEIMTQDDGEEFENFDPKSLDDLEKYAKLDKFYQEVADGARIEIKDAEKSFADVKEIMQNSNSAKGKLQVEQAKNALNALMAAEINRKNALEANLSQMEAAAQAAEYQERLEQEYIQSLVRCDFANPYDRKTYELLKEEYGYEKPKPVGMPDFK